MKRFKLLALLLTFALSGCGGSAAAPAASFTATAQIPSPGAEATPEPQIQPVMMEARRLTLEFPAQIRISGDSDVIRLTLEADAQGNLTPTAEFDGHVIEGQTIELKDLYETHNLTAEARLDLAGMEVQPNGVVYEPLTRGKSATFYWTVRPREVGTYRGVVWLHLNYEERASGKTERRAVSAQVFETRAVDFFGFSVNVVRASGAVGAVAGAVLGFPFLDDILKWLLGKKKKKK